MPVRPRVARALLVAGSALFAFGLVELGFRAYDALRMRAAGPLWAVADEHLGYRNNPAFGDHDARGFRDRPRESRPDTRVVVLGDSVAYYGDDVDDTFPGRLQARLERRMPGVDVVNTAVRGWTNWQQVEFLQRSVDALDPDVVLVAFVLNDCHRMLHAFRIQDGRIVGQEFDFDPGVVTGVDSWLYRTLRQSRALLWARRQLGGIDAATLGDPDGYSFEYRPDFRTAWLDEPWLAIEDQLARLTALGSGHGFRSAVAVFPFGDQYREDYLGRNRAYVLKPQRRLAEIAARLDLPLLDLYETIDPERHLLPDGIHLTADGRATVAAELDAFLARRGLLEASR